MSSTHAHDVQKISDFSFLNITLSFQNKEETVKDGHVNVQVAAKELSDLL